LFFVDAVGGGQSGHSVEDTRQLRSAMLGRARLSDALSLEQ
jgi:hypothetical protein